MPILSVRLCTDRTPDTSRRIAAALTDLTGEILGKKRELTAVAIEYVAPSEWFIAGVEQTAHRPGTFSLDIKITEGTNTKDEKAHYIGRAFAAVERIIGELAEASYIVIHEVRGDAWGYQGQTQEFRYIRGKAI